MSDLDGLLGSLEQEVLEVLWVQAVPCDVATVRAGCNERRAGEPLAYTTVMTVLSRLHDKRLVDRERVGRGYRYTARFDRPALVDHLGGQEVQRVLERYGAVALAHFAAALEDADPALIERLRALEDDDA